jgi:hypothetical protein
MLNAQVPLVLPRVKLPVTPLSDTLGNTKFMSASPALVFLLSDHGYDRGPTPSRFWASEISRSLTSVLSEVLSSEFLDLCHMSPWILTAQLCFGFHDFAKLLFTSPQTLRLPTSRFPNPLPHVLFTANG